MNGSIAIVYSFSCPRYFEISTLLNKCVCSYEYHYFEIFWISLKIGSLNFGVFAIFLNFFFAEIMFIIHGKSRCSFWIQAPYFLIIVCGFWIFESSSFVSIRLERCSWLHSSIYFFHLTILWDSNIANLFSFFNDYPFGYQNF